MQLSINMPHVVVTWPVRVGESCCCASRFCERMAASVSLGGDASPEDSGEDNDIKVSTL